MVPTYSERQALAFEFADAVSRMRRCLAIAGMQVDDDDIVCAWSDYSDGLCAQSMALPDADCDLLAILTKHLPPPQRSGKRWSKTQVMVLEMASSCCQMTYSLASAGRQVIRLRV